jgi:hypothetical protein
MVTVDESTPPERAFIAMPSPTVSWMSLIDKLLGIEFLRRDLLNHGSSSFVIRVFSRKGGVLGQQGLLSFITGPKNFLSDFFEGVEGCSMLSYNPSGFSFFVFLP